MSNTFVDAFGQIEVGGPIKAISHWMELRRAFAFLEEQWKQSAYLGRTWRALAQTAVTALFD